MGTVIDQLVRILLPSSGHQLQKKLRIDHKQGIKDAAVVFIVKDMRPFDAIKKVGLVNLMAKFTEIGAVYSKMSFEDVLNLLPSRQTVSVFNVIY